MACRGRAQVISRKRVGKVNEIHVEECGNAMDKAE